MLCYDDGDDTMIVMILCYDDMMMLCYDSDDVSDVVLAELSSHPIIHLSSPSINMI